MKAIRGMVALFPHKRSKRPITTLATAPIQCAGPCMRLRWRCGGICRPPQATERPASQGLAGVVTGRTLWTNERGDKGYERRRARNGVEDKFLTSALL